MDVNLHDLSHIVSRSNGYLSVNRNTDALQTNGSNFLSRLVVWVRFKTSSSYRNSILDAKRRVMASMLSDGVYGDNFRQKIEGLDKRRGLFFNNKPLSARKVCRFINDVKQSVDQSLSQQRADGELRVGLINWACGKGGTTTSSEAFNENLNTMLAEKVQTERGIKAGDVDLAGINDEIIGAALNDRDGMASVSDGTQAKAHVAKVMSRVLDRRIANLRSHNQTRLVQRLSVSGLPESDKRAVHTEIDSSKIATMDELDEHVNQQVITQVEGEFTTLLQQVRDKHDFHDELGQLPEVREQVASHLAQLKDYKMLSIEVARDRATQLLSQWVQSKQEALQVARQSPHPKVADLLVKLTLHEAHANKAHIQSFGQTIMQTLDQIYAKDRSSYEALGVGKTELFSMLYQFDKRGVLFNRLQRLVKESQGEASLLDESDEQIPDSRPIARRYIESVSKPMIESYSKIEQLRGKIPQHIYRIMMEKVSKGYVWEPRFISAANGLHINSLVEKDNEGLYELLDSPQVARKRIGSREDFVSFSLDDLLRIMLGPKNINNPKKRRQAIDQVIPKEAKVQLLNQLDRQLQMVRSRVMNEEDATALFERGTVRFLRAREIDFEAMTAK